MRCARRRSGTARAAPLAVLAVLAVAAPAHAVTNLYALQSSTAAPGGKLVQYAVGPGGALTRAPPDITLPAPPQDIAITPDGRFAYVMTSEGGEPGATIVSFARAPSGRLELNGPAIGPISAPSQGIIVNPQGTRVYYGHPTGAVYFRVVDADGTLGPQNEFALGGGPPTAYAQWLAMTPDGRHLYAAQFDSPRLPTVVWQASVDPLSGLGTPKSPAAVAFPTLAGGPDLAGVGRLATSPTGATLYVAADSPGVGIGRWTIEPATGLLGGGSAEAPAADGYAEAVVALATNGAVLWAPSGNVAAGPERVRQFAVGAGGALVPLAPAVVAYAVAGPARDAAASPDGGSLYLGQSGAVSEWSVAAGGTPAPRNVAQAAPESGFVNAGIALRPSQAPVAAFSAAPAAAGSPSSFDGTASTDPDGSIARYDWDFGDGTSAPDGGPVALHVYATAGARAVTLTVTDADGTSTAQLWTGTQTLRNGGPSARTSRSVTIAARPRPHKGRSVTVAVVRGTIRVRVPGARTYVPVAGLTEIPLGAIIDARRGRVRVTAEVDARTGTTQSSVFWDWYFKILQTKGSKPVTEARLAKGSFAACSPRRSARQALTAQSAATRSKRRVRRLWGRGTGSFRTGAKRSSATVRGTYWLVEDRCDGTLTRVKTGRVDVRDFRLRKTVRLRPGRSYLAKAP